MEVIRFPPEPVEQPRTSRGLGGFMNSPVPRQVSPPRRGPTFILRDGELVPVIIFLGSQTTPPLTDEWMGFIDYLVEKAVARCVTTT